MHKDNTYHGLSYTSRGALAGTRNSYMGATGVTPKAKVSLTGKMMTSAFRMPRAYVGGLPAKGPDHQLEEICLLSKENA